MKRQIFSIGLLTLGLGVATPPITMANINKGMSAEDREKKLNKMSEKLKLTPDQKEKVRQIKENKHQKMEDARNEANRQIREALTPEQQRKFDEMIAND